MWKERKYSSGFGLLQAQPPQLQVTEAYYRMCASAAGEEEGRWAGLGCGHSALRPARVGRPLVECDGWVALKRSHGTLMGRKRQPSRGVGRKEGVVVLNGIWGGLS